MTKRELCERLMKSRDYLAAYEKLLIKDNRLFDADDLGACADALRDLLLDIAVPEEEKHPGIIVPVDKKHPSFCLRCGGNLLPCAKPGLLYCRKCDKVFDTEEGNR